MIGDVILGRDDCGDDDVTEYLVRDGQLYRRVAVGGLVLIDLVAYWIDAVEDLEIRAAVSLELAELCCRHGAGAGEYPARARACESAARAIREQFDAAGRAGGGPPPAVT